MGFIADALLWIVILPLVIVAMKLFGGAGWIGLLSLLVILIAANNHSSVGVTCGIFILIFAAIMGSRRIIKLKRELKRENIPFFSLIGALWNSSDYKGM
jgi:hypothetical protein